MDKYECVLNIVEHPNRYTPQELEELLSDAEAREIYDILCKTDSAVEMNKEVDIDAEWTRFERKAAFRKRRSFIRGNRVASIAVILLTSILAVAAGIAVSVAVSNHKKELQNSDKNLATTSAVAASDTIVEQQTMSADTEKKTTAILFENESLATIMEYIAKKYDVKISFEGEDVAQLHFYYTLDPSMTLEEVIDQLNNFESINITLNGDTLIID